jgi:hypothetical protein
VAETVGADPGAFLRLLRAAATVGLLAGEEPDQFRLTALGACLRADSPDSVCERVPTYSEPVFWRLIGGLAECVRTGRSTAPEVLGGTPWDYYVACSAARSANVRASRSASARICSPRVLVVVDTGSLRGWPVLPDGYALDVRYPVAATAGRFGAWYEGQRLGRLVEAEQFDADPTRPPPVPNKALRRPVHGKDGSGRPAWSRVAHADPPTWIRRDVGAAAAGR